MATASVLDRDVARALRNAQSPVPRTRREFLEAEIYLPDGPRKGEQFRFHFQPYTRLLIDELDRDCWPEVFITGPSQSGKTLIAHVTPVIYAVAELRRNVVVGIPDGKMATDKWLVDFRPIFLASPTLKLLLPRTGPGSQGGSVKDYVQLANGCVVRFMTAGGDDTARAGFTAEGGVFVTEAARWSHASETSEEAEPLEQLKARMQATRRRDRRLIVEGTLTTALELPLTAQQESTQSQILGECPHCGTWVAPEREHLIGWREAASEIQAAEEAYWICPACAEEITSDERRAMNAEALLVHRGQSVKKGKVVGDPPQTERLWFRWSMFHNQLLEGSDIAPDEWKASRLEKDSDQHQAAEKKLSQFVWCRPYEPPCLVVEALQVGDVSKRAADLPKGELPADTKWITIGCDVGMYWLHWVAIAWRESRCAHIPDYETIPVLARGEGEDAVERQEAVKIKLLKSLDILFDRCSIGWAIGGQRKGPDRILVDAGWLGDIVHAWCKSKGLPFFPSLGYGTGQRAGHVYAHPTKKTNEIREIGEAYHVRRHQKHRTSYFRMDSDHWKSEVHRALRVGAEQPGSLSLYRDQQHGHKTYERHLLAEQIRRQLHPKHGYIEVFENPDGKPNHYADATYSGFVGGHHAGFRLTGYLEPALELTGGNQSQSWWSK